MLDEYRILAEVLKFIKICDHVEKQAQLRLCEHIIRMQYSHLNEVVILLSLA